MRPLVFGCGPTARCPRPQPQGAGNSSPTAWLRSVSPSPASPAQPSQPASQPSSFCAISPAMAFAAICSRMQPPRWLRPIYTGVRPPRLQLCSPTHGKQCPLYSQPAFLCGYRVAERAHVHQNRHCDGRNGDTALQLRRITDSLKDKQTSALNKNSGDGVSAYGSSPISPSAAAQQVLHTLACSRL